VVADGLGELDDVGAGGLAQLGHGVDEGDLGGQEGVGGDLDQLGGGVVGEQSGDLLAVDEVVVDLVQHRAADLGGLLVAGQAVDHAVGGDGVLHREALAQELRVPHQDRPAGLDLGGDLGGGAHWHGGLAHHHRRALGGGGQVGQQGGHRAVDLGHV